MLLSIASVTTTTLADDVRTCLIEAGCKITDYTYCVGVQLLPEAEYITAMTGGYTDSTIFEMNKVLYCYSASMVDSNTFLSVVTQEEVNRWMQDDNE